MSIKCPTSLFVDNKSRGYAYFGVAPPLGSDVSGGTATKLVNVEIQNGRGNSELTLDETSFELVECPTKLSTEDFYKMIKDKVMEKQYQDEVSEFVKAKLGCDKVICFNTAVRNAKKASGMKVQGYATGAPHTDSSSISGDEGALQMLEQAKKEGDEDVKNTKYKRYLYLNLWRNISDDPIEDNPLAMMDERTAVKPDDYLPRDLFLPQGQKIVQYGLNARHADAHKWYYFPRMTKSEGILFKQIDSDWTKTSRTCFHMAVKDPNAPKDSKPRESVELRMYCFWKEAEVDSMPSAENLSQSVTSNTSSSASNLQSASALQLFGALTSRLFSQLPFVGILLGNPIFQIIIMIFNATFATYPPYSGDPESYVERMLSSLRMYPVWPSFAKTGIEKQVKGKTLQEASKHMATILVNDATGNHQTKKFSKEDKAAIVKACVTNEDFVKATSEFFQSILA